MSFYYSDLNELTLISYISICPSDDPNAILVPKKS